MRHPRRHKGRHAGPRTRLSVGEFAARIPLPEDRPLRPLRGHLRRAGVRTLARTLVAAAVLVGLANLPSPSDLPTGPSVAQFPSPVQRELMERFDCSSDGFGDGSAPRSAIIREDGDLRVVSFDRGWQVYTGTRPHALVAICHAPPR
jgi:hypothetical protein